MMLTSKNQKVLPLRQYLWRQFRYLLLSALLIGFSLAVGTLGYMHFGNLGYIDGIYNASMILTGMGPVNIMSTDAGKIFASCYALFSGIMFLSTVAILFAPLVHRLMHIMHIEDAE